MGVYPELRGGAMSAVPPEEWGGGVMHETAPGEGANSTVVGASRSSASTNQEWARSSVFSQPSPVRKTDLLVNLTPDGR
jgi:hypothetical protein